MRTMCSREIFTNDMLSILCVRLTIKVKVGIPESFKVGWYPPKKTGSSHLKLTGYCHILKSGMIKLLVRIQTHVTLGRVSS